jgi:cytoskeletal protein CcmA (bactofilin family)
VARKGELLGVSGSETLIGTNVVVKGNLSTEGDIIIDGSLVGEINSNGKVTLDVNADVTANIVARNVNIAGSLKGNLTIESETIITETGRVEGDITTNTLAIASGAIFNGQSRMMLSNQSTTEMPPEND